MYNRKQAFFSSNLTAAVDVIKCLNQLKLTLSVRTCATFLGYHLPYSPRYHAVFHDEDIQIFSSENGGVYCVPLQGCAHCSKGGLRLYSIIFRGLTGCSHSPCILKENIDGIIRNMYCKDEFPFSTEPSLFSYFQIVQFLNEKGPCFFFVLSKNQKIQLKLWVFGMNSFRDVFSFINAVLLW